MNGLQDTARKIKNMDIRGAGRIARAAASALKGFALQLDVGTTKEFDAEMNMAARVLLDTRPTAVSLYNAVMMVIRYKAESVDEARASVVANADQFIDNSNKAVEKIGEIGSKRIQSGDTVLTHCNSMAAITVISSAHKAGKDIRVIATESRPRCQGLLTIAMLNELGIDTTLIVDSAVRSVMNNVDLVVVGADVVTANGSLVNKIGTSQVALCAYEARSPFVAAAETYKFSPKTLMGEMVPIEERSPDEVATDISNLKHVKIFNPGFDVTPHRYIDMIFTEVGAIPPEMSYMIIKEKLGWEMDPTPGISQQL